MLLLELIDTNPREVKRGVDFGSLKKSLGAPIGSGYFAHVYKGKRPNTVIKVAKLRNSDDAYVQFIATIKHHQDNPFFPRIYNAKLYKSDGRYLFVVEMEKLFPLKDPRIRDAILDYLPQQIGLDTERVKAYPDEYIEYEISDLLRSTEVRSQRDVMRKLAKNPQFLEALDVFEQLLSDSEIGADTHAENWMVRLTGHGPQLVITDPVYTPRYV